MFRSVQSRPLQARPLLARSLLGATLAVSLLASSEEACAQGYPCSAATPISAMGQYPFVSYSMTTNWGYVFCSTPDDNVYYWLWTVPANGSYEISTPLGDHSMALLESLFCGLQGNLIDCTWSSPRGLEVSNAIQGDQIMTQMAMYDDGVPSVLEIASPRCDPGITPTTCSRTTIPMPPPGSFPKATTRTCLCTRTTRTVSWS